MSEEVRLSKEEYDKLLQKISLLETLVDVSVYITSTLDKTILLPRIMEVTTKVMNAEASSLMLLDEETGELYFEVALGEKGDKIKQFRIKMGEGIAGSVAETGEILLVKDVSKDPRFAKRFDDASGFKTKSILCVPMKIEERLLGVLEVINKKGEKEYFTEEDVDVCVALANMAAVAVSNAESYKNAITDKLTQLYNFGFFKAQLIKEIKKSSRYNQVLSLIIMDIDHFKNYNDTNGHQEGNVALITTAKIISSQARESDTVARYGGEEFVVLLPQTTKDGAYNFAERVRKKVETTYYAGGKNQPLGKVTLSAGIAEFPIDASNEEELIVSADKALYHAKQTGRNKVVMYGSF